MLAGLVCAAIAAVVVVRMTGLFEQRPRVEPVTKPSASVKTTALTGHLSVKTEPSVRVFEGKTDLGASPLELDLEPGVHTLHLVNRAQNLDQTVTATLDAGVTTQLSELAKGTIAFKIAPWAYVKLDGRMLGQTPIGARQVFEGVHTVELTNTQLNESRRLEVRVKGGETKTIAVDLEAQ